VRVPRARSPPSRPAPPLHRQVLLHHVRAQLIALARRHHTL